MAQLTRDARSSPHWRRLGLAPGAPECVIKAAHRVQIEMHHPDRGGDAEAAKQINAAYDELKGSGAAANEYVAANYRGEPWAVLGVSSAASPGLVRRAGKLLIAELGKHPRLVERVEWALANFARAVPRAQGDVGAPAAPPPPTRRQARTDPRAPAHRSAPLRPGTPAGLRPTIDLGTVQWRSDGAHTMQLTWEARAAPYALKAETDEVIRAEVVASKVVAGRFSITFSINWDAPAFDHSPKMRGYTLDANARIAWTSEDAANVRIKGVILYPAVVSASPTALALSARLEQPVRASIVLTSSAPATVDMAPPAWLRRVDGSGRVVEGPINLVTNTPVRVEFGVHWPPIIERGASSLAAGRAVRPTGVIVVRWNDRELTVPAEMIVQPR